MPIIVQIMLLSGIQLLLLYYYLRLLDYIYHCIFRLAAVNISNVVNYC